MAVTALRAMVRKDLQIFFSDRRAVIMSFIAPIAIASFFGAVFTGSSSSAPSRIPVMIANLDTGVIARAVVASLRADSTFAITMTSADSATSAVREGKATVAIVIPAGFGDAAGIAFITGSNKPELQLRYDPSHGAELGMVRGMLTAHIIQAVDREVFSGPQGRVLAARALASFDSMGMPAEQQQRYRGMLDAAQNLYGGTVSGGAAPVGLSTPYSVRAEAATSDTNVAYNGYAHAFGGMGVQFLLFAAIDLGIGILLERQRGLWKRLRSAPVSRSLLLGGKAVSGMLITLMTLLVAFAFAIVVFKVRIHGSVAGFLLIAVTTSLMASTFGLLVAALGRTPSATRGVAILAVLLMVMLGGAWVPSFIFPAWLQRITVVIPARWAVDGLDAMTWRGLGFSGALLPSAVLLGFAVLFGVLAVSRFEWEER